MTRTSRLAALTLVAAGCSAGDPAAPSVDAAPPVAIDASLGDEPVPADLFPEVGFLDVAPQATAAQYPARMFYAFRPADVSPADKPLFVVFDGGPGVPTSSNLLVYGTGPTTLVAADVDARAAANPASFTRFANLLYVDERQTGFSYGLDSSNRLGTPEGGACQYSILDDAADFVRAIAAFLGAHASLAAASVVLMGESYGGVRSMAILHLAGSAADTSVAMPDDVRSFFGQHGAQLGRAVLIQPDVLGAYQYTAQQALIPQDPYLAPYLSDDAGCPDGYDVQQPCGWSEDLWARAVAALADPTQSTALLGVDLGTATDLLPTARAEAFRPSYVEADPAESAFTARFGALASPSDRYWSDLSPACLGFSWTTDVESPTWFFPVLATAKLFITNARYDSAIYTPAIPYVLQQDTTATTTVDTTSPAGAARPGVIHVSLATDAGTQRADIRFPSYDSSGHMVAVTQGADLANDVEEWLGTTN